MAAVSSSILILGIVVVIAVSLAMGVLVGWHLRGYHAVPVAPKPERAAAVAKHAPTAPQPFASPPTGDGIPPDQVRELLAQIYRLADQATAGMGKHTSRVESISRELTLHCSGEAPLEQVVLDAAKQLLQANEQLRSELHNARDQLQEHARKIESHMVEARTDGLCGVANRRAFDEELARHYRDLEEEGRTFSLILLDVDHFKKFNDAHGHQAGDEVLRSTSKVLQENVRQCDTVARYGGEEFAVIVPDASFFEAQALAEQIRAAVAAAEIRFQGQSLRVSASLGVAEAGPGQGMEALVKGADQAMYAAKQNGRNRAYFFNGQSCEYIDPQWFEENRDMIEQVEQQLDEELRTGKPVDRRNQPRRPFPTSQFIAPYFDGQLPTREMFRQVPCHDISSGGFSFLLPEPPDFQSFVVALGVPPKATYLTARVIHTTVTHSGPVPMCLVGCRFTGRVDLSADSADAATPAASS